MGSGLTYSLDRWIILYIGLKSAISDTILFAALDIIILISLGWTYDYLGLGHIEAAIANRQNPVFLPLQDKIDKSLKRTNIKPYNGSRTAKGNHQAIRSN